jgi:hypothetical protein
MQDLDFVRKDKLGQNIDSIILEIKAAFFVGYEGHMQVSTRHKKVVKAQQVDTEITRCAS